MSDLEPRDEAAELADLIGNSVRGGDSLEAAVRRVQRWAPADIVERGRVIYERRVGRIRDLRDRYALVAAALRTGHWYGGPTQDDVYWPALRNELLKSGLTAALPPWRRARTGLSG